MVLVLDPLVKGDDSGPSLIQPPREPGLTEPDLVLSHRQRSDSSASDHSVSSLFSRSNLDPGASDKSLGSAYRVRLDSGASDRSQSPSLRGRLNSGASEQSINSQSHIRQRLGSDVSNSDVRPCLGSEASDSISVLTRNRTDSGTSASLSSEERGPLEEVEEVATSGSTYSTHSETESRSHGSSTVSSQSNHGCINDQDQPDGAILSRSDPTNCLLNGTARRQVDVQKKVDYTVIVSLLHTLHNQQISFHAKVSFLSVT